jgi:histidine ammonia-lyase
MPDHLIDNELLDLSAVPAMARDGRRFRLADAALARLEADRAVVEQHLQAGAPVYGLTTGLGGNIGYRPTAQETLAWQRQIIAGRMIGVGDQLPDEVARTALLLRADRLFKRPLFLPHGTPNTAEQGSRGGTQRPTCLNLQAEICWRAVGR